MKHVVPCPSGYRIYRVVPPKLRDVMGGRKCFTHHLSARTQSKAEDEALPILKRLKELFDAAENKVAQQPVLMSAEQVFDFMFGDNLEYVNSPFPMPRPESEGPAPISFSKMIDNWVAERKSTATISVSSIKDARFTFGKLAGFLKHDNAARVTAEDMKNFKLSLKGAPSSNLKHLRLIKAVFNVAFEHKTVRPNPCAELKIPAASGKGSKIRFNVAELQKIIAGLEAEDNPAVRWLITLALYSGARLQDFADARTTDFRKVIVASGQDVPARSPSVALRVRDGKTEASVREFPLHQAIIDAGFTTYLDSLPAGPLFPMIPEKLILDESTGEQKLTRTGGAGGRVNRYLDRVGVYVARQKTFHCFRHTYKTVTRHYVPREDVSDYLTGSANQNASGKSESRKYGDYPLGILKPAVDSIPSDVSKWWFLD